MADLLIGTSGWNYGDPVEKGGWVGSVYPDSKTRRLSYYSTIFKTAELDATFYERFYSKMSQATFYGMIKATPDNFQFSVKVPETVTHVRRLDIKHGAMDAFTEFLEKISPLKKATKLGAILIQLPPSFSVSAFKQTESFLERLPRGYEYALEFRHPSWQTEGPWELLKHYNVAAVMTDSPDPNLQYLSNAIVTADHAFIRFHGRKPRYWYDYAYSPEELRPWVSRANQILENPEIRVLRAFFNNHNWGNAVDSAIEFLIESAYELTPIQAEVRNRIRYRLSAINSQTKLA